MIKLNWSSYLQIESFCKDFSARGAVVSDIGFSAKGNRLYSIEIGDGKKHVVIVAGMHANELSGCLSAISLCDELLQKNSEYKFTIIPAIDVDNVIENSKILKENDSFLSLASVPNSRDFEGQFTAGNNQECINLKNYIDSLENIDFYFSLHSTCFATPGAFFYIDGDFDFIQDKASVLSKKISLDIPLLSYDPTLMSEEGFSSGFFKVPGAQEMSNKDSLTREETSLEYVLKKFKPKLVGVSEVPLGLFEQKERVTLEEIGSITYGNEKLRRGASFRELRLSEQIKVINSFVYFSVF